MDDGERSIDDAAEADALRAKGRSINRRAAILAVLGTVAAMAVPAL